MRVNPSIPFCCLILYLLRVVLMVNALGYSKLLKTEQERAMVAVTNQLGSNSACSTEKRRRRDKEAKRDPEVRPWSIRWWHVIGSCSIKCVSNPSLHMTLFRLSPLVRFFCFRVCAQGRALFLFSFLLLFFSHHSPLSPFTLRLIL